MSREQPKNSLSTIVVDLTPILPGGDNGGAKIFVLSLIKHLAELSPNTKFILLTQSLAHEELSSMEGVNISCKQAITSRKQTFSPLTKFLFQLQYIPYIKIPVKSLYAFIFSQLKRRQSKQVLKNIQADLLFCPFTAPTFYKRGVPTVCVIYDLQYKTYPHFFSESELFQREQTIVQTCKRANLLTAISEYSRQSLLQHHKMPPQKIRTVYIQIPQAEKSSFNTEQLILKKLHLIPQQYILYPANFWKHKNHEMLLTAFQTFLKQTETPMKLVCTGAPGERQQWLMKAAKHMGLEESVVFPGYLCADNLAILLSNAKAVVFPSLYEGFGLPLIEAMAAGIPVACSNKGSLPEIAGNAALIFDATQSDNITAALHKIISDSAYREELINHGYTRAAEFSNASLMAKQYWDIFIEAKSKASKTVS